MVFTRLFHLNHSFEQDVTNEQEEYAQPFVDALNSLHNSEKAQQPQTHQQQPQSQASSVREFSGTTGAIVANPAITTTTTSTTILSKVGMSGGSVTYTTLGIIIWTTSSHILSVFFSLYTFNVRYTP